MLVYKCVRTSALNNQVCMYSFTIVADANDANLKIDKLMFAVWSCWTHRWWQYLQLSRYGVLRQEGVVGGCEGGAVGVVHGEVGRSVLAVRQLLPHWLGGRVAGKRKLKFLTHLCPNGSLGIVSWWVVVGHLSPGVVQRGVKRRYKRYLIV